MQVSKLSEQERSEVQIALRERKERLEALQKTTMKATVPTDYIDMRLALYSSHDVPDGRGGVRMEAGLIALFGDQTTLTDEQRSMERDRDARGEGTDHAPDLFGGGAETGGGNPPGETTNVDDWNARRRKQDGFDDGNDDDDGDDDGDDDEEGEDIAPEAGATPPADEEFDPNRPAAPDDEEGIVPIQGDRNARVITAPRNRRLTAGDATIADLGANDD